MSEPETRQKKRGSRPGTLDLSDEDITSLDDDAVASMLQEAIEEAAESQILENDGIPRAPLDPGPPSDDEGEKVISDEEFEEISVDLLQDAAEPELLPGEGGMMLGGDDDAGLAFPDHLYTSGEEVDEAAETTAAEPAIPVELLEELEALRDRVDAMSEDADKAALERRGLLDDIETLRSQSDVYKDRLLKLNEEFEAYRRRVDRDRTEVVRREAERVLRSFLPVLDHMELALQHARATPGGSGLLEGVELILAQFHKTFVGLGVQAIPVEPGQPFDPNLHDAVMREDADGITSNHISRELRAGYVFDDRLLRASRVAVAERPSAEEQPAVDETPADEPADGEPAAPDGETETDDEPPGDGAETDGEDAGQPDPGDPEQEKD